MAAFNGALTLPLFPSLFFPSLSVTNLHPSMALTLRFLTRIPIGASYKLCVRRFFPFVQTLETVHWYFLRILSIFRRNLATGDVRVKGKERALEEEYANLAQLVEGSVITIKAMVCRRWDSTNAFGKYLSTGYLLSDAELENRAMWQICTSVIWLIQHLLQEMNGATGVTMDNSSFQSLFNGLVKEGEILGSVRAGVHWTPAREEKIAHILGKSKLSVMLVQKEPVRVSLKVQSKSQKKTEFFSC